MTEALVRVAEPREIEACVELALEAAAGEQVACDAGFWSQAFARDIEHRERHLVVAVSRAEIVGYARAHLFEPEPDAAADTSPSGYYLIGLFVRPDCRRSGLGAALTDARLRWISERTDEAWFFANAGNTASIELHHRFGFEEVTRHFSFPGLTFEGGEGILFRARLDCEARTTRSPRSARETVSSPYEAVPPQAEAAKDLRVLRAQHATNRRPAPLPGCRDGRKPLRTLARWTLQAPRPGRRLRG